MLLPVTISGITEDLYNKEVGDIRAEATATTVVLFYVCNNFSSIYKEESPSSKL